MSNDAAILAQAILSSCDKCRICGCSGDSCSLPDGEKCCWVDKFKTLCSNPRCLWRAELLRKRHREQQARADARAQKAANVPWWVRRTKKPAQKRRTKKTKGRAA